MKKFSCAVLSMFLLLAFSSATWAGSGHFGHAGSKKNGHNYYRLIRERIHQIRVHHQFRAIKHRYNKAHPDARQLFLEYLGANPPSADEQVQALKEEYEQKLAEKDSTIAAMQNQIEELTTQISAECDARLAAEQETWQADTQQQLETLNSEHNEALNALTTQLETACDTRLDQAYAQWQASAEEQCQGSGTPMQNNVLSTGSVRPYAIDVDNSGNIVVLDRQGLSITIFDATGAQLGQWTQGSFVQPSGVAVDSQGNVYVMDRMANASLQKFSQGGVPMPFNTASTVVASPAGIYIDSNDAIYVTDYSGAYGGRVQVFDNTGNFIRSFGEVEALGQDEYNDVVVDENNQRVHILTGNLVASFDMNGAYLGFWAGDFASPYGIAVGANGDIFIADTYNNEVDQYDSAGSLKSSFAQDTDRPFKIVTDAAGKLYVADYGNRQIKIFE